MGRHEGGPDTAATQVAGHHGIGPRPSEVVVSLSQLGRDGGMPALNRPQGVGPNTPTIPLSNVTRGVTGDVAGHPALPSKKGRQDMLNLAHRAADVVKGAGNGVRKLVLELHHNASLPPNSADTEYDTSPGGKPKVPIEHQVTHRLPPRALQSHDNGRGVPGSRDMSGAYTPASGDQHGDITDEPTHTPDYAAQTLANPPNSSPPWEPPGDFESTFPDRGFHLTGLRLQGSFPPLPARGFDDGIPVAREGEQRATDVLSAQLVRLEDDLSQIAERVVGNVGNVLEDGLAQTYQEFLGIVMQLHQLPQEMQPAYLDANNIPSAVLEGDVGLRRIFIQRVLNGIPQAIQQKLGRDFSNTRQTLAERMDEVLGNQVPALTGENLDDFINSASEDLQTDVMVPFREAAARDDLEEVRELFRVRGSSEQFLASAQEILGIQGTLDDSTRSTLEGIRALVNGPKSDRGHVVEQAYLYRFLTLIRRYRGQEAQQPLPIAALALMTFAITPDDFEDYVRFNYKNIDTKRFKGRIDFTGRDIYLLKDRITPEAMTVLSNIDRVLKDFVR